LHPLASVRIKAPTARPSAAILPSRGGENIVDVLVNLIVAFVTVAISFAMLVLKIVEVARRK
jgi:VanZ family protein